MLPCFSLYTSGFVPIPEHKEHLQFWLWNSRCLLCIFFICAIWCHFYTSPMSPKARFIPVYTYMKLILWNDVKKQSCWHSLYPVQWETGPWIQKLWVSKLAFSRNPEKSRKLHLFAPANIDFLYPPARIEGSWLQFFICSKGIPAEVYLSIPPARLLSNNHSNSIPSTTTFSLLTKL